MGCSQLVFPRSLSHRQLIGDFHHLLEAFVVLYGHKRWKRAEKTMPGAGAFTNAGQLRRRQNREQIARVGGNKS